MTEDEWLPIYDHMALGTLKRAAYDGLRIQCVNPSCKNWHSMPLDDAIAAMGPAAGINMLAWRCRCRHCGQRGAHVEPGRPPGPGASGYAGWALAYRKWLQYQLACLGDVDSLLPPDRSDG